jgi:hypothetical protein
VFFIPAQFTHKTGPADKQNFIKLISIFLLLRYNAEADKNHGKNSKISQIVYLKPQLSGISKEIWE